uniref:Ig-like domain-containing protein n=1 Tax=Loxodonta africana TaxID=9785 RepID=G3TVK0_LOXAF
TCTVPWACEQGTPPIFSWNSAALTSLGPRAHLSSVLTLSPRPQDHGTSLTCQVTFPAVGVTVKRTIQLNISFSQGNSTGSLELSVGKSEPRSCSEVLGAAGGASSMALLCLCLFFIFRVKTQRKKAARTVEGMNDTNPVLG